MTDSFGGVVRPGIIELLNQLREDRHTLSLWTNSTRDRARWILYSLGLREYFTTLVFREDYDADRKGLPKDIRRIKGDILVDDDPKQINFAKSVGKRGFLISRFDKGYPADHTELRELYKSITKSSSILRFLYK